MAGLGKVMKQRGSGAFHVGDATECRPVSRKDAAIVYYNKFFTAEQVVKRALKDMKKGKDVSIVGPSIRTQVFFTKLLPHKLVMKIWLMQQKKN